MGTRVGFSVSRFLLLSLFVLGLLLLFFNLLEQLQTIVDSFKVRKCSQNVKDAAQGLLHSVEHILLHSSSVPWRQWSTDDCSPRWRRPPRPSLPGSVPSLERAGQQLHESPRYLGGPGAAVVPAEVLHSVGV